MPSDTWRSKGQVISPVPLFQIRREKDIFYYP